MAVEKISLNEINNLKGNMEVEQKLPKAEALIKKLAKPYSEEVEKLVNGEQSYIIDGETGDIILSEDNGNFPSVKVNKERQAKIRRNIEVIRRNREKLSTLEDANAFIAQEMAKGATSEQAHERYVKTLLKHIKGSDAIATASEEELNKMLENEGV